MKKKLIQVGNSLAFIIDKPILELIGINADTELEMNYDGQKLSLTPVHEKKVVSDAFRRSVNETIQKHRKTFEMLAQPPSKT